jgi:hypothetical protein
MNFDPASESRPTTAPDPGHTGPFEPYNLHLVVVRFLMINEGIHTWVGRHSTTAHAAGQNVRDAAHALPVRGALTGDSAGHDIRLTTTPS